MTGTHEYSKLKIALEYLESAVDEYDVHSRCFSSMNLAFVGEELFGKFIRVHTGKPDRHTKSIDSLLKVQKKFDLGLKIRLSIWITLTNIWPNYTTQLK
jgi:hypothetical protein